MKYKPGDRVRVIKNPKRRKSYYMADGQQSNVFNELMMDFAGKVVTIESITVGLEYTIREFSYYWTDEMFEGLADEPKPEPKPQAEEMDPDEAYFWSLII